MSTHFAVHQVLAPSVVYGVTKDGYWGYEHPKYLQSDWIHEVREQATMQSYHQWVTSKLEEDSHETSN